MMIFRNASTSNYSDVSQPADLILEPGYTKAYPHGIRHVKKLDKLALTVSDWKEFNHYDTFKGQIYQNHGRKHSFWSKYEEEKK